MTLVYRNHRAACYQLRLRILAAFYNVKGFEKILKKKLPRVDKIYDESTTDMKQDFLREK